MSSALNDFCELHSLIPSGCFLPSKYGIKGCIPELINRVDESFSGTNEKLGIMACPLDLKKFKYFCLTSFPEYINLN